MYYRGTHKGDSLKHYRTPGSKNGFSKDPNYTPIGQKAMTEAERIAQARRNAQGQGGWVQRMASSQRSAMANVNSQLRGPTRTPGSPALKGRALQTYTNAASSAYDRRNAAYKQAKQQATIGAANAKNNKNSSGAAGAYNQKKDVGAIDQSKVNARLAEQRRISGGNAGGGSTLSGEALAKYRAAKGAALPKSASTRRNESEQRRIQGSAMAKSPAQRQKETEQRRIAGGNKGVGSLQDMAIARNKREAAERVANGGRTNAEVKRDQQRSNYLNLTNRRKAVADRTGVTSNKAAAEARRISGSKLGSNYTDTGAGNFRRGTGYLKTAVKNRDTARAGQAAREFATGAKKGASNLVKKGRKKVKNLMRRYFG